MGNNLIHLFSYLNRIGRENLFKATEGIWGKKQKEHRMQIVEIALRIGGIRMSMVQMHAHIFSE